MISQLQPFQDSYTVTVFVSYLDEQRFVGVVPCAPVGDMLDIGTRWIFCVGYQPFPIQLPNVAPLSIFGMLQYHPNKTLVRHLVWVLIRCTHWGGGYVPRLQLPPFPFDQFSNSHNGDLDIIVTRNGPAYLVSPSNYPLL